MSTNNIVLLDLKIGTTHVNQSFEDIKSAIDEICTKINNIGTAEEERQYKESLFPDTPSFEFTHPSRLNADETEVTTCYRSEYGITWQNAKTGLWRSFSFDIIAC